MIFTLNTTRVKIKTMNYNEHTRQMLKELPKDMDPTRKFEIIGLVYKGMKCTCYDVKKKSSNKNGVSRYYDTESQCLLQLGDEKSKCVIC